MVGFASAVTTIKYLGFNPRSAFVTITAMVTTVPAALRHYATAGTVGFAAIHKEIARAGRDYAAFMKNGESNKLSLEEQRFLSDIKAKHYDDPQYTRDAIGLIRGMHGKGFAKTMEWAMYLFGKTEQWNRGATMLAAYRLKQGNDFVKREAARTVTEKSHGVYGRATLPSWAQGANPAATLGQMLYVFTKFGPTWLQMAYDLGFKKKDLKSFAWAMGSPIVLGGAAAIPMKSAAVGIIGAIMSALGDDRDPEKVVWDKVRRNMGDTAERSLRYGVSGFAGVDISGSLSFDPVLSNDIADFTGPIGGVVGDISTAARMVKTGQPLRAVESVLPTAAGNVLKAVRERGEGARTQRGNRIFDEKNRPLVPSKTETGLKIAGFRSSKRATLQSRTWEKKKEYANFKDRRDTIYEAYKAYLASRDPKAKEAVLKKARAYNRDVTRLKADVPKITKASFRSIARRMKKPSKRNRLK